MSSRPPHQPARVLASTGRGQASNTAEPLFETLCFMLSQVVVEYTPEEVDTFIAFADAGAPAGMAHGREESVGWTCMQGVLRLHGRLHFPCPLVYCAVEEEFEGILVDGVEASAPESAASLSVPGWW